HSHRRSVPAPDLQPPASPAVVGARRVRTGKSRGRGHGDPTRRGVSADPVELPRTWRRRSLASCRTSCRRGHVGRMTTAPSAPSARVRERMDALGTEVLLLSLGADLPWLTGYEAMPLERLTMLVVPADADATLVVPGLEAPRVREHPEVFSIRPWAETEDPLS